MKTNSLNSRNWIQKVVLGNEYADTDVHDLE